LYVPAGSEAAHLRCVAVLTWQQCLLGVLLPTLVAGFTAPTGLLPAQPEHPEQPARPEQSLLPQQQHGTTRATGRQATATAVIQGAQYTGAAVSTAVCRINAALLECCRSTGSALLQLTLGCGALCASLWQLGTAAAFRGERCVAQPG
jgi:hypothetical protein